MAIQIYDVGDFVNAAEILRDTNIIEESNVYASKTELCSGGGCSTVWFNSVPECRAYLRVNGEVPSGCDAGLCEKCRCHYSVLDIRYEQFEDYACKSYKEAITQEAKMLLIKKPVLGRKNIDKQLLDSVLEEKR